jgi:hypothetical protein
MIVAIVRRVEKSPKDGWQMQVRRNLAMVAVEVVQVPAVLQEGEGVKVSLNQLSPECEDQEGEIRRTRSGGRSRVSEVECEAVEAVLGVD